MTALPTPADWPALAPIFAENLRYQKGIPFDADVTPADIATRGWSLRDGSTPCPAAVLRAEALSHNLTWMAEFCRLNNVQLAPHGKTTMAPQLFAAQQLSGAWGLTVATPLQAVTAHRFGIKKLLIANQIGDKIGVQALADILARDADAEIMVLADSVDGVALLSGARKRPIGVLVEVGYQGGRTGCRTDAEALAVARAAAKADGLFLAGVECYEGMLSDTAAVEDLLGRMVSLAETAAAEKLFPGKIVISAGGSTYFDLVARTMGKAHLPEVLPILRSGCYVTQDSGTYEKAFADLIRRGAVKLPDGPGLQQALEVWANLQSRPEPELAFLTGGKRDLSHDDHLPRPLRWWNGKQLQDMPQNAKIKGLNDQHGHLVIPADWPGKVGDRVILGISHPCTTFDKWPVLLVVDKEDKVVGAVRTFF
ncbi:alanine racemase [Lacibacterium aquatile]|uniref:Alanine racemase n=1 Tax=Lacibacterium aquatile TaxID=1168082 RepID=A0ABW5DPX1_9PROT